MKINEINPVVSPVKLDNCPVCGSGVEMVVFNMTLKAVSCTNSGEEMGLECPLFMPIDVLSAPTKREAANTWHKWTRIKKDKSND